MKQFEDFDAQFSKKTDVEQNGHKETSEEWNERKTRENRKRAQQETAAKRSLTPNSSIVQLSKEPFDQSRNLLGNRWLSRGCGAIICAPSGIGKSTMSIQTAAGWSAAKVTFGINPVGALRILVIQSEDDRNDMREMAKVVNEMEEAGELSTKDLELIDKNTHVEKVNDLVGQEFIVQLDVWLTQLPRDLVIINPFMSYVGIEVSKQAEVTNFLRTQLNPLLEQHNCGALLLHHIGKLLGEADKKREWWEYMYLLFGSSELTNWARAILFIKPSQNPEVFEFISAKRHEKIGWTARSYFFSHSQNGKLRWVSSTEEDVNEVKAAREPKSKKFVPYERLLTLLKPTDKFRPNTVIELVKKHLNKGKDWAKEAMSELAEERKLVKSEVKNPKGQPFVFYHLPTLLEPATENETGADSLDEPTQGSAG